MRAFVIAMLHTYQSIYSYPIPAERKHSRRDSPTKGIHSISRVLATSRDIRQSTLTASRNS